MSRWQDSEGQITNGNGIWPLMANDAALRLRLGVLVREPLNNLITINSELSAFPRYTSYLYAGVVVEPSLLGPILEIHLRIRAVVLAVVRVRVRVRANQANPNPNPNPVPAYPSSCNRRGSSPCTCARGRLVRVRVSLVRVRVSLVRPNPNPNPNHGGLLRVRPP